MATREQLSHALADCDGLVVQSPEGEVGSVEETWIGPSGEPQALAVRTVEGRRGLLLAGDIAAVDREYGWVVVDPKARLLELEPPRLTHGPGLRASWATTGATLPARPPERPPSRLARLARKAHRPARTTERSLIRSVIVLYSAIVLILALMITLVFVIGHLAS